MDAEKLLIVMTSGPETPRRCATPFFLAQIAAAMEYEVTMLFTIDGILLLKKGLAEHVYAREGGKFVAQYRQEAVDAGARLVACTPALELHDLTVEDLIDGVEMAGGAALLQMAAESTTVLTF
jgi:predicted peroxiredoxin